MNKRILKAMTVLAALALMLGLGWAGGDSIYAAQEANPEVGIVTASVAPDGPAASAGVVRGDILQEVNGEAVENAGDLVSVLADLEPGEEVELTVLHGDDVRTLTATLGERNDRAYLGLTPCGGLPIEVGELRRTIEERLPSPGAVVAEVMPDSPAEQAGLREGDVIVAVEGQELGTENDLADLIAEYEIGDEVTLQIERPGEEPSEITVELGEHPEKEGAAYLGVRYSPLPRLAILREGRLPFDELQEFGLQRRPFGLPEGDIEQGIFVRQVTEDSPASVAGLQKGDVITAIDDEPVASPRALSDAIAEREPGDDITLTVYRPDDEEAQESEVTLGEHPDEEGKPYLGVTIGGFFRLQRNGGNDQPRRFDFFQQPFDFNFQFELPFDLEKLPFDLDELPRLFEFRGAPGEEACEGCLGSVAESA